MSSPSSFIARSNFSPSFARRLSKRRLPSRSLHTTSPILNSSIAPKPEPSTLPPSTALSALLSRLSLPSNKSDNNEQLHSSLITCLTHPSYFNAKSQLSDSDDGLTESEILDETQASSSSSSSSASSSRRSGEDNELLSNLGNSLLGLFASEHLTSIYPLLPTQALKNAITSYVGPQSCLSIARELGISVQGGGNFGNSLPGLGRGSNSTGLPIRWSKTYLIEKNYNDNVKGENIPSKGYKPETVPVGRRFQKFVDKQQQQNQELEDSNEKSYRKGKRENYEDVVASTVRAFVGLIYQEQGIHAAREFVHAHFLSRSLDLTTLFNFKNPFHVLSSVISQHLTSAGVPINANQGVVEKRLLASTGINSQSPLYLIGLFLPSGIKLAEGHGSSKAMAEHRAAKNALLSLFLVRSDSQSQAQIPGFDSDSSVRVTLPSSLHTAKLLNNGKILQNELEQTYKGSNWGGKDVVAESRDLRRKL